jgi:hypothetical protein
MKPWSLPACCLLAATVTFAHVADARAQSAITEPSSDRFAGLFSPNDDSGVSVKNSDGIVPSNSGSIVPSNSDSIVPSNSDASLAVSAQSAQEPPEPMHTGLAALFFKTVGDFKAFPRRESTWVILGIGAGAAGLARPEDHSLNARIVGSEGVRRFFQPGHILGSDYVQVGTAVGLYTVGRYILPHHADQPQTNKWSHLGFDLLRAQIVSGVLVQGIKVSVRRDRPTGECCAFPSGHSAATFATAAVLERHLGYRAAIPTLAIATYVATSRLHDNRHYLSDVLFGAAVGTATGWTVVGTHGRSDYSLIPVPTHGGVMLAVVKRPSEKS